MQERIFQLILDGDEVSWQSMLYSLVKKEGMDPWDIDVSLLVNRFIEMLKKLKEMDFRISGKVILAAAILLKIKSVWLLNKDISSLDRFLYAEEEEDYLDEIKVPEKSKEKQEHYTLFPRLPQQRRRKVSIFDLVNALEKALEVEKRKVLRHLPPPQVQVPRKRIDISGLIKNLFERIKQFFFRGGKRLTFSQLVPSQSREDKVFTFIPLLHLTNQRKIDLLQKEHFGEIEILLKKQ